MLDPRACALEAINLDDSRVAYCDSHVLLLCGGKAPEKDRPDDPDPPIKSLRHALMKSHDHRLEFYTPENVTDWKDDGVFKNLIDLELELAAISSLVVIILESPGAIAELGAFSQLEEFNKKIIVILSREFRPDSFIGLGILRHIESFNSRAVRGFPWAVDFPQTITEELVSDVISDLGEEVGRLPGTQLLKITNNSHVFILLYELINLFVAVKESELIEYLAIFGLTVKKDEMRRKLFLMRKFKIIEHLNYSDSWFYVVSRSEFHRVILKSKDGSVIDKIRLSIDCRKFYNSTGKDNHRLRVIRGKFGGGV